MALLRPVGDEAPAIRGHRAPLLALDDDEGLVGRGDVVAPPGIVDERLRPEDLGQLGRRPLLGEPSAHRPSLVSSAADGRLPLYRPGDADTGAPAASRIRPTGRLTRERALALLGRGDELLASGDFAEAGGYFSRVVGFDDPAITAAALLGLGEAHYRLNDEAAAVQSWTAVLQLPETPSTYSAWRNIAAARVRDGDLTGAIDAYREADRRAPPEDKAEIANRLGWLTKETGDTRAAGRYFARGRGDVPRVSVTLLIIAVTTIVSLTALLSTEGQNLYHWLQLDKAAVADGEYWRLWTVTCCTRTATRSTCCSTCTPCTSSGRSSSAGTARSGSWPSTWPAPRPARRRASCSVATRRRSARRARSSGCSGSCSRPAACTTRSTARAGRSSAS